MSTALLTQLYIGYFNRAPDPEGLTYWEGRLTEGMTPAEIAQSFSVQPESTSNYPYLDDQAANDAGAFIAEIYQNLFNRAPDPEGLAYWTAQLEAGRPVGGFILDVINGARDTEDGQDNTMLQNKLSVGTAFVEANQGQTGDAVIAAAKDVMSGVNQSEASVKMALGKISDAASGATTVFTGNHLGEIEDGTLFIDGNRFTFNSPDQDPNTVLVTNGADLEITGTLGLGGLYSSLTVRGNGSSANIKADFDDSGRSDFGRFSGDKSEINVADGASLSFGKGIKLGRLLTEEDRGTAGGNSEVALNILGGGEVHVTETARFAYDS